MATLVAMSVDPLMSLRDVKNRLSEVVEQVELQHDRCDYQARPTCGGRGEH